MNSSGQTTQGQGSGLIDFWAYDLHTDHKLNCFAAVNKKGSSSRLSHSSFAVLLRCRHRFVRSNQTTLVPESVRPAWVHLWLCDLPTFPSGNGTIERSEFEENFDMQEPSLALLAHGLFIEFDADKSGHINMADLLNLYNRIDLNNDGSVSKQEFIQYFSEVLTVVAIVHLRNLGFS
ncbi:hypothetical protein C0Q70_17433 [Pomacea canaliculata]|uniref:EF-hand domain-containing protein n=1 Tax=Pomacea canaliculata TaxID=400727 RepID=A0A2T7NKE1_POMCA|nr:hypothetical protein C0Q70_17433 [Pomacea canaliculata]